MSLRQQVSLSTGPLADVKSPLAVESTCWLVKSPTLKSGHRQRWSSQWQQSQIAEYLSVEVYLIRLPTTLWHYTNVFIIIIIIIIMKANNNNNHLTASFPGQPG